jgi:ABC-type transport system involved in cytochrome bd biosynthesis fused ATPase/permease subunit
MGKFFMMICGWFVSGVAISMGAPFWFDLLGKVVNVRNTGKAPTSSAKK